MINDDSRALSKRTTRTILDRLEDSVGGRENFIDTLGLQTLDKKQEHFLRLLCDPARARHSILTIARDAGLLPVQVLDMYRKASFVKAEALAMGHLQEKMLDIVEDLTSKSVDAKIDCPRCWGEGFESEGVKCAVCLGRGQIMRPSDLDHQKVALEVGGLLKKGPGVAVQVNQQVNNGTSASTMFSKYVKSSDDTAYDVSDIIDVEKVEDNG